MRIAHSAYPFAVTLLLAGGLALGCSGAPESLTPFAQHAPLALARVPDHGVLGGWTLALDPASGAAELMPLRSPAAVGDSWWINATGFFTGSPCNDCLQVRGIQRDPEGRLALTFRVRHPFKPGDPGLPPTAANRLDLHVFDAQLHAIRLDGTLNGEYSDESKQFAAGLIVNAAGYSSLLAPVLSQVLPGMTADTLPYVTVNEDRSDGNWDAQSPGGFTDLRTPSGRNVFPMGADVLTPMTLGLTSADGPQRIHFFLTVAYGQSAPNRFSRLVPTYYSPEFNARQAWRVELEVPEATNNLLSNDPSSSAQVEVAVYDWQATAPVDPELSSLGSIKAASEPVSVDLIIPGVLPGQVSLGAAYAGTGPGDDPLRYSTLITNTLSAAGGEYVAMVRVVDSRQPDGNSGGVADGLSTQDGLTLSPFAVERFATYQLAPVVVAEVSRQLLSIAISPAPQVIMEQGAPNAVSFTAEGTFSEPPLTEDITGVVNWTSSRTDRATFSGNVLTASGFGITLVSASLGAVTSNQTEVLIKPMVFRSDNIPTPFYTEAEVHQADEEIYIAWQQGSTNHGVRVFDGQGLQVRSWNTYPDLTNYSTKMALDEGNNRILVGAGQPVSPPGSDTLVIYSLSGVKQTSYALPWNGVAVGNLEVLENGQFWTAEFSQSLPDRRHFNRYNPDTGVLISNFSLPVGTAMNGTDHKDNLIYVADPGGRYAGTGVKVVNPATQSLLASYSQWPSTQPTTSGNNQNDRIALDGDGLIHLTWSGSFEGSPTTVWYAPVVQVYRYTPPGTLTLLYEYHPIQNTQWILIVGFGLIREQNRGVVVSHIAGQRLTWIK